MAACSSHNSGIEQQTQDSSLLTHPTCDATKETHGTDIERAVDHKASYQMFPHEMLLVNGCYILSEDAVAWRVDMGVFFSGFPAGTGIQRVGTPQSPSLLYPPSVIA